jgi:hypothetical protein
MTALAGISRPIRARGYARKEHPMTELPDIGDQHR